MTKVTGLVPALVIEMGQAYPELRRAEPVIIETLRQEEERFRRTLGRGMTLLDEATEGMTAGGILSGETAFKLYDTYGFPLDLTQDAVARGAVLALGGTAPEGPGNFFAPTILLDVAADARVMTDEPFGPIAPLVRWKALDDVLGRANSLAFGLVTPPYGLCLMISCAVAKVPLKFALKDTMIMLVPMLLYLPPFVRQSRLWMLPFQDLF